MVNTIDTKDYLHIDEILNEGDDLTQAYTKEITNLVTKRLQLSRKESEGRKAGEERRVIDQILNHYMKEFDVPGIINDTAGVSFGEGKNPGKWDFNFIRRTLTEAELEQAYTPGGIGLRFKSFSIG